MAIILDKRLQDSSNPHVVFNSHQNRTIKFHSDTYNANDVAYAIIQGGGTNVKIYPNAQGYFEYNLRDMFIKFRNYDIDDVDAITISAVNSGKFGGTGITAILLQIFNTAGDHESNSDMQYIFITLRASEDMDDIDWVVDVNNPISNIGNQITWFKGYPFDFTIMGAGNEVVNSGGDVIFTASIGTRVFVTDGFGVIDNYDNGIWRVLDDNEVPLITLNLTKRQCNGGVYLKWLSLNGTYKYWLFNERHKAHINTKDAGHYLDTFRDDNTNNAKYQSFGKKESVKIRTLKASGLKDYERDYILDIIRSPRVYIYTGTQGQVATLADFKTVEIVTNSLITNDFGKTSDIQIQIKEYLNDLTV